MNNRNRELSKEIGLASNTDYLDYLEGQIERLENENSELRDCVVKAEEFLKDVMPQIGKITIQNYQNLNELHISISRLLPKDKTS